MFRNYKTYKNTVLELLDVALILYVDFYNENYIQHDNLHKLHVPFSNQLFNNFDEILKVFNKTKVSIIKISSDIFVNHILHFKYDANKYLH